jgi:hypothetical protein
MTTTTTTVTTTSRILQTYIRHSQQRPFLTNSVVGGGVFFIGDGTAQLMEGKRDIQRLVTATAWNGLFASPFFFFWFRFLDTRYGVTRHVVPKKVLINTLIATPPVNFCYLTFSTLVEGIFHGIDMNESIKVAQKRIQENIHTIILTSFMFWILVNSINFLFVPPQLRVLPSVFGGVLWSSYLSHAGHADTTE